MRHSPIVVVLSIILAMTGIKAQAQSKSKLVGLLIGEAGDPETQRRVSALKQSMQDLGWHPDKDIKFIIKSRDLTKSSPDQQAQELIAENPDIVIGNGTYALALIRNIKNVPIVFTNLIDPLGSGVVSSLANPGGNVTGFSNFELSIGGKWLSLLLELAPGLKSVAVLEDPNSRVHKAIISSIRSIAIKLQLKIILVDGRDLSTKDPFQSLDTRGMGLIALSSAYIFMQRSKLLSIASKHNIPAIYPYDYYARNGGLMSYGIDPIRQYRLVASYVDKILRGMPAGSLPVQSPDSYKFVINSKTVKSLGLVLGEGLRAQADEVVE